MVRFKVVGSVGARKKYTTRDYLIKRIFVVERPKDVSRRAATALWYQIMGGVPGVEERFVAAYHAAAAIVDDPVALGEWRRRVENFALDVGVKLADGHDHGYSKNVVMKGQAEVPVVNMAVTA